MSAHGLVVKTSVAVSKVGDMRANGSLPEMGWKPYGLGMAIAAYMAGTSGAFLTGIERQVEGRKVVRNMDPREVKIGDSVVFVDGYGIERSALVTSVWLTSYGPNPGVNLVYVSGNEGETDQYGRQLKRETSVVHQSNQPAPGMYWKLSGS